MVRLVSVLVAPASTALAFVDFFRGLFAKEDVHLADTRASLLDELDGNIKALPELRASQRGLDDVDLSLARYLHIHQPPSITLVIP